MSDFRTNFSFCLVLFLASDGFAITIVDQTHTPSSANIIANAGGENVIDLAQTFTVGTTGNLTGFELLTDRLPVVTQPLLLDIRTTQAGAPSEADSGPSILVSEVLPASLFPVSLGSTTRPAAFTRIELNAKSFPVAAGDVLAIALRSDDPGNTQGVYRFWGQKPGIYTRGSSYIRFREFSWQAEDFDLLFRTMVTPIPEPSAALLAWMIAPAVGWRRRTPTRVLRRQ